MNIKNQTLRTTLIGDPVTESVTVVESDIFVPIHTHDHGSMSGLYDDDHPQYMTEDRAYDFMLAFYQQQDDRTQGENLGGGVGIFLNKNGATMRFKTLIAGDNVTFYEDQVAHTITISANKVTNGGTY